MRRYDVEGDPKHFLIDMAAGQYVKQFRMPDQRMDLQDRFRCEPMITKSLRASTQCQSQFIARNIDNGVQQTIFIYDR